MLHWFDSLTGWLGAHPEWLGLALFLVACGECLALVGILVPGTILLFGVGVLAGGGVLTLGETLLLAYSGGLLGDLLSYALGRRFQQRIRRLPLLRSHPQWLDSAEAYMQRYGIGSLLVGRFIGPLRPLLPMVAGMLKMPLARFSAVSVLAGAGWSVAYLVPGWATGAAMRLPLSQDFWGQTAVVAGLLAIVVLLSIHNGLRQQPRAAAVTSGLGALLLLSLLLGWRHLSDFDQGLLALVQSQRSPELDSLMVLLTRLGDFSTQFAAGSLLCLLLLLARKWRASAFAASTLLLTALANSALKHLLERPRPAVLLEPLQSFSLPSGHSSAAFAFCLVLGVLAGRGQPPRWRLTWLLLASLPASAIALSRVYLGVHWPTDILAGALLASSLCAGCLSLSERRQHLPEMAAPIWWLILPASLVLFIGFASTALPATLLHYRY
ncbi:MAG: bifunctional DedA family/phosphatase PAP2 family protein [Pseudomonas sp.]|uniref:bifunctional DedA family/phosphatase PAP2 family protein n=1 Tax=Pseudomonas sp. TaxID=306 RepID=UPI003BB5A068